MQYHSGFLDAHCFCNDQERGMCSLTYTHNVKYGLAGNEYFGIRVYYKYKKQIEAMEDGV